MYDLTQYFREGETLETKVMDMFIDPCTVRVTQIPG
jgi:hypothetical protein